MKITISNKSSLIAILFSTFVVILVNHNFNYWNKKDGVIRWDIISYYAYLPAFFVYHDLELKFHKYEEEEVYIMWPKQLDNGQKLIKTTMGLSFMYLPFFLMAHGYAHFTGLAATGYTSVYKYFIVLSTIFYFFLGGWFVRKILLKYFDDKTTAITLIVITLGTNLYFFSTFGAPMPHTYLFFLFAFFLWLTISWYETPKIGKAIMIGLIGGLITLIRPTDIIIVIIFIFYGMITFEDVKMRIKLFFKFRYHILTMFFFAFLIFIPQFLYWKLITGHYIYYSYGDEHFFWTNPHIIDGLFSYRKGWLIYTPMMSFALVGIFFLKKALKKFFIPLLIFVPLNIYIIFSWWCWWYGGSFGQRAFIESYAIMSIPLAMVIYRVYRTKIFVIKSIFTVLLLFFIYLNMFNSYQYIHEVIHYDGTTKELYWKYFGRYTKQDTKKDYWDLINRPDYELAKKGIYRNKVK